MPELHRRTAGWYASNAFPGEAVRHALAGRDWQLATTVLLEHWNELIYDEPTVLRELLALLPPELANEEPEQVLASAADRIEATLPITGRPANRLRRSVPLLLAVFQLGEAWLADDLDRIAVAALKMLALLGDAGSDASQDDGVRSFALCALAAAERCTGELDAAEATLQQAMAVARRAGRSAPGSTA